ncbi:MAG: hypothetical protein JXR51_03360 [Bacteroidales bacterium]|nr:hypothetical protein [Bacteroidales bacterium]MBN2756190.1 hypothetical protein [Bacteroidales bacterium]
MKKIILISALLILTIFNSCKKDEANIWDDNYLPENFKVDIPSSINSSENKVFKTETPVSGNEIYFYLTSFIHIGDEAAQIVEDIINSIRQNNLSQEMSFSFTSDDDGRLKNVTIIQNSDFEGITWQYQLTMTDAESENNADNGLAMQIFWNKGTIKGVAIIKPYNVNRNCETVFTNAMFRVDYSEAAENGYEQEMTVYISDIQLPSPLVNPYAMETLKMNVGKTGNIVEVYGNSNHPNAVFFTADVGFNWAFVAAGETESNIGLAEVGLPPSDLNSDSRTVILETYSLKNVFTNQIYSVWPGIDPVNMAVYLQNTDAPGYFNSTGFVQGGTSPGSEYNAIDEAINDLVPYNPYIVSNMHVQFKY